MFVRVVEFNLRITTETDHSSRVGQSARASTGPIAKIYCPLPVGVTVNKESARQV